MTCQSRVLEILVAYNLRGPTLNRFSVLGFAFKLQYSARYMKNVRQFAVRQQ